LFPPNISIVLNRLRSYSEMMCFTSCVHVPQWCHSFATLRGTLTPRMICKFECVCVYVLNEITTPCHAKKSTVRSLDSGLTVQIRIDAHRSKPCLRGRPRRSFWTSQQTCHSSGLRVICLGLSHVSKEFPFCLLTVSFHVCQANASRQA